MNRNSWLTSLETGTSKLDAPASGEGVLLHGLVAEVRGREEAKERNRTRCTLCQGLPSTHKPTHEGGSLLKAPPTLLHWGLTCQPMSLGDTQTYQCPLFALPCPMDCLEVHHSAGCWSGSSGRALAYKCKVPSSNPTTKKQNKKSTVFQYLSVVSFQCTSAGGREYTLCDLSPCFH
jgi:hypothetical protein